MLAIKIDEHWLDLPADAAMSITLNNPAFDPERIGRAYSYPIKIQHTQRNLFAIKHRNRIDNRLPQQYIDAKAYIQDQLFEEGRLNFNESTNQRTEATFQNLDLSLAETLGDMKLLDILPVIEISQSTTSEYWLEPTDDRPYELRINGTPYSATGVDNPDALSNLVDEINAVFPGIAFHNAALNRIEITHNDPTIVLGGPLFGLEVTFEYTIADAKEANLRTYFNTTTVAANPPVSFPVVYAPNLYGNLNLQFNGYINYRLNGSHQVNSHFDNENSWENTYVPFYRVRYILDTIASQAGLEDILFDLTTAQAAALESLLVWNNYCLDQVYPNENFEAGTFKNGFATQIDPENHLPDITALDFINRLAKAFNFHFRFRENRLFFTPNIRQIRSGEIDWSTYAQPYYERTFIPGTGVTIAFEDSIEPQYSTQFDDYVLGEGFNQLDIPFRPVHAITVLNSLSSAEWKTAYFQAAGISEPLELETEDEAFRLFFDQGEQEDEDSNTYWMASYDNTDYAGTEISALSLDFPGAAGIYLNFWKGWAEMLFKPTVTRLAALPVGQLLLMRSWENTKVYIYDNQGAALYVVRSIQFKASAKGLGIAQIEMQML